MLLLSLINLFIDYFKRRHEREIECRLYSTVALVLTPNGMCTIGAMVTIVGIWNPGTLSAVMCSGG